MIVVDRTPRSRRHIAIVVAARVLPIVIAVGLLCWLVSL